MFAKGFKKIAAGPIAQMTPEEYYALVGEKDPYVGAAAGATTGALRGLYKGPKGGKAKSALIRAAVGAGVGGVAGHYGSKVIRGYQAGKVRKMTGGLRLRSSPGRSSFEHPDESGVE